MMSGIESTNKRCKLWIMLLWTIAQLCPIVSNKDESRCTSTFHVWQPGHDAQQMIRELYLKMDNVTTFSKLQVSELRTHLYNEVNKVNNWTLSVDKRILEMQVNGMDGSFLEMKYDTTLAKMQIDIDRTARRVGELESAMYNVRSKLRSNHYRSNGLQQDQDKASGKQTTVEELTTVLKDSIGDLKAEWLVLKRDVEGLKKEEKRQRKHLQQLKNERASLKTSLAQATSINKDIQTSNSNMQKTQSQINDRMDTLTRDTSHVQHLVEEFKAYLQEQRDKLVSVQTLSHTLETRLDDMDKYRDTSENMATIKHPDAVASTQILKDGEWENVVVKMTNGSNNAVNMYKDCHDVYRAGFRVSSVYYVKVDGMKYSLPVYCLIINGTGYTLIQRRLDGTINFNRRWMEYRQGFGNLYGEIWMGNEFLHHITSQKRYILRVDLWDWEGNQFYAEYKKFKVEGETGQYRLHIGNYTGNAGDAMSYHDTMAFSTEDVDNDLHPRHCGAENKSGWWFNSCFLSQLNGLYHIGWYSQTQSNFADGIVWYTLKNSEFYSLHKVEMTLKPLEM